MKNAKKYTKSPNRRETPKKYAKSQNKKRDAKVRFAHCKMSTCGRSPEGRQVAELCFACII